MFDNSENKIEPINLLSKIVNQQIPIDPAIVQTL